jgi:hypothetical protein
VILGKFWSRFDLRQRRNRKFLCDDQGCLSEQTVYCSTRNPNFYKKKASAFGPTGVAACVSMHASNAVMFECVHASLFHACVAGIMPCICRWSRTGAPGCPVQKHKDVLFWDDHNFINNHPADLKLVSNDAPCDLLQSALKIRL